MKVLTDKSKINESELPVETREMLEIEEESQHLTAVASATQEEMAELYTRMLQNDFDE